MPRASGAPRRPTRALPLPSLLYTSPCQKAGLYRKLLGGQSHGVARKLLVNPAHLEHDAAGLDDRDVVLRGTFTAAHAGFGRLLSYGFMREDVDPDLPTSLDLPGHRDTGRLYLAVGDPGRLQSLQPVLTELHLGAALGLSPHPTPVGLPVLELLRHQHLLSASPRDILLVDAVVDPDLDPDLAHLGLSLFESVIYVRIQGVQRHPALGDRFLPAHLDTAQATAALDPDTLGPAADRARKGTLHRPPERRPTLELLGDGLRHERGVELRTRYLSHVDLHLFVGKTLKLGPQGIDLAAALADDYAGTGCVDIHRDLTLLGGLADLDVGDAGPTELLLDVLPDPEILTQEIGEVPIRIPATPEVYLLALALYAKPEALRVYFLAHLFLLALGRVHDRQSANRGLQLHRYVAGPFADHSRPAHRPSLIALYRRSLVDLNGFDPKLVGVHIHVVLGVGGGAVQDLA